MRYGFSLFITLLLLVCAGFAQSGKGSNGTEDTYRRWVNEDVAWIITPAERAEYLRLTTDSVRDQFIVQFWIRRDPTPDTAENEFKEEHYRRIAYTNEHFADSNAGWKSDRGRIYIVYGPPERIQRTPRPMTVSDHPQPAEELWRYSNGREFRFIDACACGYYELDRPQVQY
jgi:GWxTD domain-containing protein